MKKPYRYRIRPEVFSRHASRVSELLGSLRNFCCGAVLYCSDNGCAAEYNYPPVPESIQDAFLMFCREEYGSYGFAVAIPRDRDRRTIFLARRDGFYYFGTDYTDMDGPRHGPVHDAISFLGGLSSL